MFGDRTCPKCGQLIPRGTTDCPICKRPHAFQLRREVMLLVYFGLLIVLGTVAGFAVKALNRIETRIGWSWYTRGERSLQHGAAAAAVLDYRNALYHDRANSTYELQLAHGLVVSGHLGEARAYLTRLWRADPANGPVNLEFAQLEMKDKNVPQVINYYHAAIDGVWPHVTAKGLLELRERLCNYLIAQGLRPEALAELMALAAQAPNDAQIQAQLAGLFSRVGDYNSALKEYQDSLRLNPRQKTEWAGAGKAAFETGNYESARYYLNRAVATDPHDRPSAQMLQVASDVIGLDPFERGVPVETRRKRAIFDFNYALSRLENCAKTKGEPLGAANPQTDLQTAYGQATKLKPQMQLNAFRRNPDLVEKGMRLAFQIEQLTAKECGPPQAIGQALLLISNQNKGLGD
jgi:tetratricopeptide (TPR) repeat protein